MSLKSSSNFKPALVLAAVIFVIAFILFLTLGDYGFIAALFLALLLAFLSGIVLYLSLGLGEGAAHGAAHGGDKPQSAKAEAPKAAAAVQPVSDAAATAGDADAEAAKVAEIEAAKKAEQEQKAAEAEAARKAAEAEAAEAAKKAEAERAEAEAAKAAEAEASAAAMPASAGGEDYDKDGVVEGENEGTRPAGLDAPRGGQADDLKMIKGVGPKMEQLCNSLGFWHFDQVASWSADEVAWVDANLKGFKGRVSRDNWVDQARTLASGGETEFSKRVEDGDVY